MSVDETQLARALGHELTKTSAVGRAGAALIVSEHHDGHGCFPAPEGWCFSRYVPEGNGSCTTGNRGEDKYQGCYETNLHELLNKAAHGRISVEISTTKEDSRLCRVLSEEQA